MSDSTPAPDYAAAQRQLELIEGAPAIFFLPKDDLLKFLVPAIGASSQLDCMMGFFSSSSFAEIAPGLASYLRNSKNQVRLLISPFVTKADQAALAEGLSRSDLATSKMLEGLPTADDLTKHTLACLAWLIKEQRLEIRIAFMKDGLFHPKVWLLNVLGNPIAFHGSSNLTGAGLSKNKEQVALSRSWVDENQRSTERLIREEFGSVWDGDDDSCDVIRLPEAVERKLLKDYGTSTPPSEIDRVHRSQGRVEEVDPMLGREFRLPEWLRLRDGPFKHQGAAIDSWLLAKGRGVLAMATGSGKTLTALAACHELKRTTGPMLIVAAAPYVPLVMQWCKEIELFNVRPRNLSSGKGVSFRKNQIAQAGRNLGLGIAPVEALVVSHHLLCDPEFQAQLDAIRATKVLIADEMHNLGAEGFISRPPEGFEYRLGLSATPVRQYDPDGTDRLLSFFGPVCFEFSLDEAIGVCLVPYDYYIHRVELDEGEMEEFRDLSDQIRRLAWKLEKGESDTQLDNLLRKRRLVVECARGKLTRLADLISQIGPRSLRYDLIYATDKGGEQLESINGLLRSNGVLFHQITCEETTDRKLTAEILRSFQNGELRVLTAKRVLDEGVNVPQIERAFILASTTVERQWVQRRGRILRTCDAIGKSSAVIHDFIAMPPRDMVLDDDARALVRGELRRAEEFCRLARNYAAKDGPLEGLQEMQKIVYQIGGV